MNNVTSIYGDNFSTFEDIPRQTLVYSILTPLELVDFLALSTVEQVNLNKQCLLLCDRLTSYVDENNFKSSISSASTFDLVLGFLKIVTASNVPAINTIDFLKVLSSFEIYLREVHEILLPNQAVS